MYEFVWYFVGAAALFGGALAWGWHATVVSGKRRMAITERDAARAETGRIREELNSLYEAHRQLLDKLPAGTAMQEAGNSQTRDARLERLETDIQHVRQSVLQLQARLDDHVRETAVSGEAIVALQARNEQVEEQISSLEAGIQKLSVHTPQGVLQAQGNAEARPGFQDWNVQYLSMRAVALEEKLLKDTAPARAPQAPAPDAAASERLARLRWRNRYLESRLAHLEETVRSQTCRLPDRAGELQTRYIEDRPTQAVPEVTVDGDHPAEAFLKVLDLVDEASKTSPWHPDPE